jgi:PHD/YefM family antitoxin component YafN of YafNO toxin-antitoxin module
MSEQQPDLTSPENVAKGQEVYARIEAGQVTDVAAELDAAYGKEG